MTTTNSKILARAAKAAYERFLKEIGLEHDARIREWGKLSYVHQGRWVALARAVIESFRGENRLGSESSVQRNDVGTNGLQQRKRKAAKQKPSNRNRSARLTGKVSHA